MKKSKKYNIPLWNVIEENYKVELHRNTTLKQKQFNEMITTTGLLQFL